MFKFTHARQFNLKGFSLLAIILTVFGLVLSAGSAPQASAAGTVIANDSSSYLAGLTDWSGWGHDVLNSRFNPFSENLNSHTVSKLQVKWAFVFPDATAASSQPAVVGANLYVGGWNGKFYALNANTGKEKWSFDTATVTGQLPAGTNAVRDGAVVAEGKVYFGDYIGNFYALDTKTGALAWVSHLDSHPTARITSSPVYWNNRIYVGVASGEELYAASPLYPCCTFRGSLIALDAKTGATVWRYSTIDQAAQQTGVNPSGTPQYGPSGAGVWSSPAIDPIHNLLFFDTGNNYSNPATDKSDAIIALDLATGQEKWHNQLTPNDSWNVSCVLATGNCPAVDPVDDYDLGASPNIFFANIHGRPTELIGAGQKSGIYHALDALTGKIIWQTNLKTNFTTAIGGQGGIQWGASWDGRRLYVATNQANPGSLSALDPATGKVLWNTSNPADGCTTGGATTDPADCVLAMPSAVTTIPGVAFEGGWDGKFRAFDTNTGKILWQYDTIRSYTGTNGITGTGGSINGGGAVVANDGMVYLNSGYHPYIQGGIGGNVLLAFSTKSK